MQLAKFLTKSSILSVALITAGMLGSANAAVVLFYDDFGGSSTDALSGRTPTITTNDTTWTAHADFRADGTRVNSSNGSAHLSLGTLINANRGNADAIYTLTTTISVPEASATSWNGVGFWIEDSPPTDRSFADWDGGAGVAFMLRRQNTEIRAFNGTRTNSSPTLTNVSPNNTSAGTDTLDFRVVLDLTSWDGSSNFGTATYFAKFTSNANFVELGTGTLNSTNSSFGSVGFSNGFSNGSISSFELSQIPEPSAALLGGLGLLALLRRRR